MPVYEPPVMPQGEIDSEPIAHELLTKPEPFPIEAFPPTLRTAAEEMAAVYNVPVCLPAVSALTVLSGAIGKTFIVRGGFRDFDTYLNIYAVLVVQRGGGKGTIANQLMKPIHAEQARMVERWKADAGDAEVQKRLFEGRIRDAEKAARKGDAEAASAMQRDMGQLKAVETFIETQPALVVDNVTSEALARKLAASGEQLLSFSSEAGEIVNIALGKYSSKGDFDLLLRAYSGDSYAADRIQRNPVVLESPRLTALWLVQDSIMGRLLGDPEAFDRGLTARPLIVFTQAKREFDDGRDLTFTQRETWACFIADFLAIRRAFDGKDESSRIIQASTEAKEIFRQFENETVTLERERYTFAQGELSRWRENAIKVAGLFQLATDPDEVIGAAMAERACAVVRWSGLGYMEALAERRRESAEVEVQRLERIAIDHGGAVTLRELDRSHSIRKERLSRARQIAAQFPHRIEFTEVRSAGPGRPSEVLRICREAKPTNSNFAYITAPTFYPLRQNRQNRQIHFGRFSDPPFGHHHATNRQMKATPRNKCGTYPIRCYIPHHRHDSA